MGKKFETTQRQPLSIGHAQKSVGEKSGHEQKRDMKMVTSSKPVFRNNYLFMEGSNLAQIWSHCRAEFGLSEDQIRFGSGPKFGQENLNDPKAAPLYWACPEDVLRRALGMCRR